MALKNRQAMKKYSAFIILLTNSSKTQNLTIVLVLFWIDANTKLGSIIISEDPFPKSQNSEMLTDIISQNDPVLCNATDICDGSRF